MASECLRQLCSAGRIRSDQTRRGTLPVSSRRGVLSLKRSRMHAISCFALEGRGAKGGVSYPGLGALTTPRSRLHDDLLARTMRADLASENSSHTRLPTQTVSTAERARAKQRPCLVTPNTHLGYLLIRPPASSSYAWYGTARHGTAVIDITRSS